MALKHNAGGRWAPATVKPARVDDRTRFGSLSLCTMECGAF